MLSVRGVNRKTYSEHLGRGKPLPELSCPDPSCRGAVLRGHGYYQRYVDGSRVELRRVRCRRCGVTHAILPEDLCAYRDLSFAVLEAALSAPGGPSARAQASGQAAEAGRRRVRRWLRALAGGWALAVLGLLPPVTGEWWARVQAVFGATPGALLRLRRWLWSRYRMFLSGLTGLYRYGRPCLHRHRHSPQVGICRSG